MDTKIHSVSPQLAGDGRCYSSHCLLVHLAVVEAILNGVAGMDRCHQGRMLHVILATNEGLDATLRLIMADNQKSLSLSYT